MFLVQILGFLWGVFRVLMQYMNEEQKVTCPRCESDLTIEIPGVGRRCQQCAFQFNQTKDVVGEAARRRRQEGFVGWRRTDSKTSGV